MTLLVGRSNEKTQISHPELREEATDFDDDSSVGTFASDDQSFDQSSDGPPPLLVSRRTRYAELPDEDSSIGTFSIEGQSIDQPSIVSYEDRELTLTEHYRVWDQRQLAVRAIMQDVGMNPQGREEFDTLDSKSHHREKFERQRNVNNGKRKNVREQKKQFLRQRLKERNDALPKPKWQPRKRHVKQTVEQTEQISLRNEIVRRVLSEDNVPHNAEEEDFVAQIKDLSMFAKGIDGIEADDAIRHAENVVLLAYHFYRAQSYTDYVVAALTYVKFYCKHSLLRTVMDFIDEFIPQDENIEIVPNGASENESSGFTARDVLDSWELLKTNTAFSKISYLTTAALAISVCEMKNITWDFNGIKLIREEAQTQQFKSKDLIDAVIHSFVWISETGVWCVTEGSLAPILYEDKRLKQFTENCRYLIAHSFDARHGNLELGPFERKLDDTITTAAKMQAVTKSPAVKEVLQKKYADLVRIKQDVLAKRKGTTHRFAPLGICIFGESSIGKSNITQVTMKTSLNAMDFDDSPEGIVTLTEGAKHDDTYKNDANGVIIDDAAQQSAEFMQEAPTVKYIRMFNSVAAQVIKAELNDKGYIFFNFKCGILTTNVKDFDARVYSNYPVAVLRRFIHVTASVKEKYRTPGGTSLNTDHPDIVNNPDPTNVLDVWDFDIEEVIPSNGKPLWRIIKVPLNGVETECKGLNLEQYLDAIIYLSKKHAAKQNKEVEKSLLFAKVKCCSECNRLPQFCKCELKPHGKDESIYEKFGDAIVSGIWNGLTNSVRKWVNPLSDFICMNEPEICSLTTKSLQRYVEQSADWAVPIAASCVPEFIHSTQAFQSLLDCFIKQTPRTDMRVFQRNLFVLCLLCSYFVYMFSLPLLVLMWVWFCIMSYFAYSNYYQKITKIKAQYVERRDALDEYSKSLRDGWVGKGVVALLGAAAVAFVIKRWNDNRLAKLTLTQAQVDESEPSLDVAKEDTKPGWFSMMMGRLQLKVDVPESSQTTTTEQIVDRMSTNLCWGSFPVNEDGKTTGSGVFFIKKSVMLFPKHMLYPHGNMSLTPRDNVEVTVTRHDKVGGTFRVTVDREMCYEFPEMDLLAAYVPNSPDFRTVPWFPLSTPTGSSLAKLVVPSKQMKKDAVSISPNFGRVGHCYIKNIAGMSYTTNYARSGTCMGPIIRDGPDPVILGFHIGGDEVAKRGIGQCLTQQSIDTACAWLEENVGFLSAEADIIPHSQYDVPVLTSTSVNPKAKYILDLPQTAFVDVHGSTKLRTEQKSQVFDSILSPHIEEICGVPNQWGPPKLKPNWAAFNANIEQFTNPTDMFPPRLLRRSQMDWEEPLKPLMLRYKQQEDIRPLDMHEVILGIPGKKYIDAMPMDTGMGFPLFGKKNKCDANGEALHFDEERDGEVLLSRTPKQHVMDEYHRLEQCWKENKRGYPVTSATLKDEPTKLDKTKVRVFQAAPVALGMHIRKYFLPIARFLHMHSLVTESAVGVNPFSKDWEILEKHAQKFASDDLMLAFDYSKYDVRMNSQLVRAAWESMIRLAIWAGYPDESISIMKAMIVDIAHPVMDINGTLMTAYNMNTSGNNMTVDVNGIVGCFLVRMGFFNEYPNEKNFRKHVAALTYGDDFMGSVHSKYRKFNFMSFKVFLEQFGMKITLPDKSNDEVLFMHKDSVDFLKRSGVYIPEIDRTIGKLSKDSIFKSLHSNLKSAKTTPRTVAASCIETALHEAFAFGREEYEEFRDQLTRVAARADLDIVPALNSTFDERIAVWHEKYGDSEAQEVDCA